MTATGHMHVGKLTGDTAAARVFRVLRQWWDVWGDQHPTGRGWIGSWELGQAAQTACVATRKSEVNRQLKANNMPWFIEHKQIGHKHYYRLVRVEEQTELQLEAAQ